MDVLATLAATGVAGTIAGFVIALVRIALRAERGRADDWRTAAQTSSAANAVLSANIDKLITSVEQLATSNREVLALLQTVAAERRSAA